MLANRLKVACRTLLRYKSNTLLNIICLSFGISCGLLIFLFVTYHLSFDGFHTDSGRIYRVVSELRQESVQYLGAVPTPLGKAFRNDYTFAEKVACVVTFGEQLIFLPDENKKFQEREGVAYAEPEFFELFNFPLLTGDPKTVLQEPNTALITEKVARKYFGQENPVGQIIKIDNRITLHITGVLKDLPPNTDYQQQIYVSYPTLKEYQPFLASEDSWAGIYGGSNCFVRLKKGVSLAQIDQSLLDLSKKYYNEKDAAIFRFNLQPLSDVHFNPTYGGYVSKNRLLALALVGFFLVATACINFVNLATAQALGRAKEIGVRKTLGSTRAQLFWQFITETALITLLALSLSLPTILLALPYINGLLETHLTLNPIGNYHMAVILLILPIIVIFLSGAYPGLVLAGFDPIQALKGKVSRQHLGSFSLRRSLVVTQFALCQVLLIGTIVVTSQMRYSNQSDIGFDKEAIIMLPTPVREPVQLNSLATRLASVAGVEKVSLCMDAPASPDHNFKTTIRYASREEEKFTINFRAADNNYLATFGLTLMAGRNLLPSDTVREYLLNETAVKNLQVASNQEVLGQKAVINGITGTIVGVIKDFHTGSFRSPIDPMCITTSVDYYNSCAVKVDPRRLQAMLPSLQEIWTGIFPQHVYSYEFVDERLTRFYQMDWLLLQLIQLFASIAILIGCLGLYGLVSYMAAQKTKEIGVRKVLGASTAQIVWLFGKEFTRLLVIAFLIAAPIGWWAMQKYLEDYQYRITIGPAIFLLVIAITFVGAMLTVGYRSIKAALTNPIKVLRTE